MRPFSSHLNVADRTNRKAGRSDLTGAIPKPAKANMSLEEKKDLVRPFVYVSSYAPTAVRVADKLLPIRSGTTPPSSRTQRYVRLATFLLAAADHGLFRTPRFSSNG